MKVMNERSKVRIAIEYEKLRDIQVEALTNNLYDMMFIFVNFITVLIEIWGVLVIVVALGKEIYTTIFKFNFNYLSINKDNSLNASLASALEVLLAAEILKTITITDYTNLFIIAALIILRIAITLLLVWGTSSKNGE